MQIPNKIKHFCWRACTESLPTLANLHPCKVVNFPLCSNYGKASKIALHALWDCNKAQCCWGLGFNKLRSQHLDLGYFPLCNNCGKASETALHALWDCNKAQCCWGLGFNKLRSQQLVLGSFVDLFFFGRQHEENIELFTVLAWFIWCRRNKCHFNEPSLPPEKLLEAAESILVEFQGKSDSRPERIKAQT